MRRIVFAIPGDLRARTGGYGYDRRLLAEFARRGVAAVHLALSGGFPHPTAAEEAAVAEIFERETTVDDVALCHHPLCLEAGLSWVRAAALCESERRALALATHAIATSPHTGETLIRDFGAPRHKLTIAPPGTDPAERARGSGGAPWARSFRARVSLSWSRR